jgi:hypothetical protein
VRRFSNEEAAIATVNDTKYGLGNAGTLPPARPRAACVDCAFVRRVLVVPCADVRMSPTGQCYERWCYGCLDHAHVV